mmetsp:Transcript_34895/g.81611  ORF Transcript_34895/g.81611 Transcript_34895/m.81611 type:complete len:388 (+) Transcript_34895:67-1230(+)
MTAGGEATCQLREGMWALIQGLKTLPDLNGKIGKLVAFDEPTRRWQVDVKDERSMLLRKANLVPCTSQGGSRSSTNKAPEPQDRCVLTEALLKDGLSPQTAVEWIRDSRDEFEALMLPLELELDAGNIRRRYKQLSLLVHPDKSHHPDAELSFKKLYSSMEKLSDPIEQRSVLRRIRMKAGGSSRSRAGQPSSDDEAEWNEPWWAQSTVHDMEKAFRDMEARLSRMGVFEHEKLNYNRRTGVNEDSLWISCEDAKELFDKDLVIFVDARNDVDFEASQIVGAINVPGHTFHQIASLEMMPTFRNIIENPEQSVIVYSDNGSHMSRCVAVARSLRVAEGMQAARVLRLSGGMNQWKRLGYPVEGEKRPLFAGHPLGIAGLPLSAAEAM